MPVPMSANEAERLRALYRLAIIDAEPSPGFWRACRVARQMFDVPMALVTLLDESCQWIKANVGVGDLARTEREHAFCNYTILHDDVLVVPDAQADDRFSANPYVTGEPHIRFYAGAPLVTQPGIRIGSFCILDTKPRTMTETEIATLSGLARLVVDEIWIHHLEHAGRIESEGVPVPEARSALDFAMDLPLTSEQLRGARALLNWSVRELAEASGISSSTIKRIEMYGSDTVRRNSVEAARRALEDAGVQFASPKEGKVGLRSQTVRDLPEASSKG